MLLMRAFAAGKFLRYPFLFAFISLQISSGSRRFVLVAGLCISCVLEVLANDPSGTTNESKDVTHRASKGASMGVKIILICLGVVTVIAFGVFLFKLWQKKKREEQHARLLKLFEEDDELEVELGMQD